MELLMSPQRQQRIPKGYYSPSQLSRCNTENKQTFTFLFIAVTKKCTYIISYTNERISSAGEVEQIDKRIYASIALKRLTLFKLVSIVLDRET